MCVSFSGLYTNGTTQVTSERTRGLLTGTRVNVLGTGTNLLTVMYYDPEGRVVQSKSQHYLSGTVNASNYDEVNNTYDFPGQLRTSTWVHHTTAGNTTITNTYTYDHMGRRKTNSLGINGQTPVVVSSPVYDELGQMKDKIYHNGLRTTAYTYNERGWLSKSSTPGFEFELGYDAGSLPQFNGNIAIQEWGLPGNRDKNYAYDYDALNRLKSGMSSTGNHEKDITYDVMGNLLSLTRDTGTPQAYDYTGTGNRLNAVSGGVSRAYSYDVNGNALSDGANGFQYNYLNLITAVTGTNAATYTYDANGQKLRRVAGGVTTDYLGGIQYANGTIEFVQTEEGIARRLTDGSYSYEYSLKDHLGNSRLSFDGSGTTIQSDSYYPFGKTFNSFVSGIKNNYLYNGKELCHRHPFGTG